VALICTAMKR